MSHPARSFRRRWYNVTREKAPTPEAWLFWHVPRICPDCGHPRNRHWLTTSPDSPVFCTTCPSPKNT